MPLEDRFWAKVDKNGPIIYDELGPCWVWTAARNGPDGYGAFKVQGKKRDAHRVAYELQIGPIPEGLCVCHKCDNKRCVRGDHLFAGTRGDNNRDMFVKGLGCLGYRHSDEARKNMSEGSKLRWTPESRKRHSKIMHDYRMSLSPDERAHTPEEKRKIGEGVRRRNQQRTQRSE